jgi:folate-dependent phosphoribosylglycinamide formyltransferase PurN
MRLLLCTKRDLHGAVFLNRLLPLLAGHEVAGVWLSDMTRAAEAEIAELAALRRLECTVPMETLFPQIDALPAAEAARAALASFEGLARRHGVPFAIVTEVNGPAARARLAALDIDLVLVARFSHIFDAQTIALPRHGLINVHPGRLPEYAGLHAPLRAVNEGAAELHCSVHWITPGIDAGPLLALHPAPLDPARSLLEQTAALYPSAISTLLAAVADCAAGRRPAGQPQDRSRRRYRSLPSAAEFEALRRRGLRLWDEAAYRQALAAFVPPGRALPAFRMPALQPLAAPT